LAALWPDFGTALRPGGATLSGAAQSLGGGLL